MIGASRVLDDARPSAPLDRWKPVGRQPPPNDLTAAPGFRLGRGDAMSLSDLASLGSFVSGVAVLVSLVFLYVQLRQLAKQVAQAETNQRTMINESYVSRVSESLRWQANPENSSLTIRVMQGDQSFTAEELARLVLSFRATVINSQAVSQHYEVGLIDRASFDSAILSFKHSWLPNRSIAPSGQAKPCRRRHRFARSLRTCCARFHSSRPSMSWRTSMRTLRGCSPQALLNVAILPNDFRVVAPILRIRQAIGSANTNN